MDWLYQNWIWIALAIGGFYLMTRMHGMGGGMGHAMGCGNGDSARGADGGPDTPTPFDPVSRRVVDPGQPSISSVYHGRAYYFENREDRDAFEADPEKYAAAAPGAGEAIGTENSSRGPRRRRGGC